MGSRAERAAEAQEEHLGALRLQEKFNCVRQYYGPGEKANAGSRNDHSRVGSERKL